jgi:hypothetical protein
VRITEVLVGFFCPFLGGTRLPLLADVLKDARVEETQMRRLIAVASVVIFGVGWSLGQAQHKNDGNGWHILPPAAHTYYVKGFSDGYASALLQTVALTAEKNASEKVSSMKPAEKKDYEETLKWAKRIVPFELQGPPKSVGELQGALDTFYGDYRNEPVCLDEAILFSVASLAGNAATDQELEAARKKGAQNECK